ncbi:helix-hairpin-helix domain-containing protein [Pendulispora rubella]|uniref:Helix-hairpin-helix domain-containing protein n=1 Tax=Pendulispora rubella TaxID=2741070 RepID=A0ABZ2L745_9BACT
MTTQTPGGAAYTLRGALASLRNSACRVGSVWSKPLTRVLLVIAGLAALAIIGRTAGAHAEPPSPSVPPAIVAEPTALDAGATAPPTVASAAAPEPCVARRAGPHAERAGEASPDDPVILNTAQADDLRRLPGVGAKRAEAILALRTRLGRFRQLEDLLRVRGIGRASLRRLRPLVRLDPPNPPPP